MSTEACPRLVIVSNRLPFQTTVETGSRVALQPGGGGLVSAMDPVLRRTQGLWVGWPGEGGSQAIEAAGGSLPYEVFPVDLEAEDAAAYYDGFSNRTLWPLFHDLVGRTVFEEDWWRSYERVNRKFAEVLAGQAREGDLVWAHDFHLLLFARSFRELRPDIRCAFFLHTPFPPQRLFHRLPWREPIARALLSYDLLGFQCERDLGGFAQVVAVLCPEAQCLELGVHEAIYQWEDRIVRARVFPIGIDFALWDGYGRDRKVIGRAQRFRAKNDNRKIILGVDRLDYSKGIPQRLKAFGELLERHPEEREKVLLLQIAVPSRTSVHEYKELKREIDGLVGHINGKFGTPHWVPVNYLYRRFDPVELAAYYRAADVALVTPIKDGMNLVAKEFCAASVDGKGALILSEFAGAAFQLDRGALIVNPHDSAGTAEALHQALHMPLEEQKRRMEALRKVIAEHDVHRWASDFIEIGKGDAGKERRPADLAAGWGGARAAELLLYLDYDGTLAAIQPVPALAAPDRELLDLLDRLSSTRGLTVVVASGRDLEGLAAWLPNESLVLVAAHGASWRWRGVAAPLVAEDGLKETLESMRKRLAPLARTAPGMLLEEKGNSIAVHYRMVSESIRQRVLPRLRAELDELLEANPGFRLMEGRSVFELVPAGINKGAALARVRSLLKLEDAPALIAGDDRTDEDSFRGAGPKDLSVHIGPGPTAAQAIVRGPAEVRELLLHLCEARGSLQEDREGHAEVCTRAE
ncbi:MAG: bifunctional alpha,alpha-trehalose-phosphate synthase (UDP-forming)/trehalose-phosphatase [Planctomycetes bacterium]|nr:bifunctional alpha,alpha-trehalose-phosphate synthase (UDP-forming)/trehalose-phosphatase [Planctomycetota bacterium]